MRSVATIATVTVLSLGIWLFFYERDMRLTASETTVVVGICLAAVLLTKWLWLRIRNRGKKRGRVTKHAKVLAVAFLASLIAAGAGDGRALFAADSAEQGEHDTGGVLIAGGVRP